MKKQKIPGWFLLPALLPLLTGISGPMSPNRIVGVWESADKDLRIEMHEDKDHRFSGQMIWFYCPPGTPTMEQCLDSENPDPALRSRSWLGLRVVENLTYQGENKWGGGKVYDPNTGHTFDTEVRLVKPDQLSVRGYWKFVWLGRSLQFRRVQ
ncbi:DUF2147 domain-containing protein [Larkinella terrae]|uniref:DUF2147 domain-containing protein n=1 Tax=Larkinella terrae TaxID=2025311 RepID=A0A7K0EE18_9BACT|nr:DUF2147 domain-containing protein [Larkinella terrae]MRS60064.1 DUF2147 domain-containing protein [Larkinella terrae]